MTVYVVTDSTACLPPALAEEYGITVLDIHTRGRVPVPADTGASGAPDPVGDAAAGSGADAATDAADDAADHGRGNSSTDAAPGARADTGADTAASGNTQGVEVTDPPGDDAAVDDDTAVASGDSSGDAGAETSEPPTTAGLGPLELTATYARLLERGGDDGVVALHLSRELSSTWSSATQAAAVFDGLVEVLDTRSAGMVLGQASIAAARAAADGGTLAECTAAARRVLDGAEVWLYVHRMDALARGGRLSTAQRLLSTALAIKPILHLNGGKIELAAKTRTQTKAMARLVSLAEDAYRRAATPEETPADQTADTDGAGRSGADTASDHRGRTADVTAAEPSASSSSPEATTAATEENGSTESAGAAAAVTGTTDGEDGRPRVFIFGGDHEFRLRRRREEPVPLRDLPPVPMHLDIHQAGCPEIAEDLRSTLRESLPECVVISVVDLSPALMVHTGPEAVGITLVHA